MQKSPFAASTRLVRSFLVRGGFVVSLFAGMSVAATSDAQSEPPTTREEPSRAPQKPLPPPLSGGTSQKPLLDVDGRVVERGVLPASTSAEARAAFERVRAASLVDGVARTPVAAFELYVDLRYKASARQTNDLGKVTYRYRVPELVRIRMGAEAAPARELVRGPSGDWLIDAKKQPAEKIALAGREYVEDRRQLDEIAGVARNFVGLTDPASLRVVSLATCPAPEGIPAKLAARAKELSWLELVTPDLSANQIKAGNSVRLRLGFDAQSGRTELAFVDEAGTALKLAQSSALLSLRDYRAVDGFSVPHLISVYLIDLETRGLGREPAIDMGLVRANLRAPLEVDDFVP